MDDIANIIRRRIKQARLDAGLNQKSLAEALDMSSQGTISRYEKGDLNVSADILYKIAVVTNKPISFFFDVAPSQQPGENVAQDFNALNDTGQQHLLICLNDLLKLYPR